MQRRTHPQHEKELSQQVSKQCKPHRSTPPGRLVQDATHPSPPEHPMPSTHTKTAAHRAYYGHGHGYLSKRHDSPRSPTPALDNPNCRHGQDHHAAESQPGQPHKSHTKSELPRVRYSLHHPRQEAVQDLQLQT